MRASTCIWGGFYNPLIPVFKIPPKDWKSNNIEPVKGTAVAAGYIRFFEPDVYVETKTGLASDAGLGLLRQKYTFDNQIVPFKKFLAPKDGRTWAEPEFGTSIHEVLSHRYKTELRFELRDKRRNLLVRPMRGNALVEALFGVYPKFKAVDFIAKAYSEAFHPEEVYATPDIWRKVYLQGANTPLSVTRYNVSKQRFWYHDLVVFVFDPTRATDLIDLWNLRLEPNPVLPIPIEWFDPLTDDIKSVLKSEHRPVIGNPHGVMHNTTIEFGRSIERGRAEAMISAVKPGLPDGSFCVKYWRNQIWYDHGDDRIHRDGRMTVFSGQKSIQLSFKEEGSLGTTFEPIAPDFASNRIRSFGYVNVLRPSSFRDSSVATVLPFNAFDRSWPRLASGSDPVPVSSEGWVFSQRYRNPAQRVSFLSTEEAIAGSLKQFGIEAKLWEAGQVAKHMLEHLGGLWGAHLIANLETLELLNNMANSTRRLRNEDETVFEHFGQRTATLDQWKKVISQHNKAHPLPEKSLEDFTKRNVIRLGLETECPHCDAKNWTSLTDVDYRFTCERCLKPYDFPQGDLRSKNRNWTYRVVGPFAVRDYALGAYSSILALRVLNKFGPGMNDMTYSNAMKLKFDGVEREIDFIAWYADERMHETHRPPQLILGESKSAGSGELITAKDISRMRSIAEKLPESVIVIAVLRDGFTENEKLILRKLVNWGRRLNSVGEPTNPVLLLTSTELTMDNYISHTWKKMGGKHAKFEDYDHTRNLSAFADSTQQIYLEVPSFGVWRDEYWRKRAKKIKGK
jgi:hypothetical protein